MSKSGSIFRTPRPCGIAVWPCLLIVIAGCRAPAPQRFVFKQKHMGSDFRIVLHGESAAAAQEAAGAAFDRIGELNSVLSDYDAESELSRLSRTGGQDRSVPLGDDLWRVLQRALEYARLSDGAFDPTVGPVVLLWRQARFFERMPERDKLESALERSGHQKLELDATTQAARLAVRAMRLDLGGIAKGYACDEALEVLRERGFGAALVEGGGDMAIGAPPPGRPGWTVAAQTPQSAVDSSASERHVEEADLFTRELSQLSSCGVATSGDRYQHVVIDGVRYSHIVDPRTGLGLTHQLEVTVVAPTATDADALASTLSVLGPQRVRAFAERLPNLQLTLLARSGKQLLCVFRRAED